MNEIIDNLLSIKQKLDEIENDRKKMELYNSNRFNPFQFMRTDEIGLSKILAFLLDPKEIHGQGDLFLNSFLKFIGKHNFLAFDSVNVVTEKTTFNNRRHDIFIEGYLDNKPHWIISIENKLTDAGDQGEQLKDYRDDLIRKNVEYCLIYLPIFKRNPSEYSIPKKEWEELLNKRNAVLLSAEDLIKWLDDTLIISPVVKQFCNDFKKFLKEELMENIEKNNSLVNYLMKNENNEALYAALNVLDSSKQLYNELIIRLVKQLQVLLESNYKELTNSGWKCSKSQYKETTDTLFGIAIHSKSNFWNIGIEFEQEFLKEGSYGVFCDKKQNENLYSFLSEIFYKTKIQHKFENNNNWVVSKYLEGNYKQWDAKILSKIPSGELAKYIFDELWKPLLEIISDNLNKIKELDVK